MLQTKVFLHSVLFLLFLFFALQIKLQVPNGKCTYRIRYKEQKEQLFDWRKHMQLFPRIFEQLFHCNRLLCLVFSFSPSLSSFLFTYCFQFYRFNSPIICFNTDLICRFQVQSICTFFYFQTFTSIENTKSSVFRRSICV